MMARDAVPAGGICNPAPGRLRASLTPALRPVREVHSLDWDRRGRVTPAGSASQEAWPGVEPVGLKASGESRGGAPRGERARSRRFAQASRSAARCRASLSAAIGWMRLSALRLPSLRGALLRVAWHSSGAKKHAARTNFYFVIASQQVRPEAAGPMTGSAKAYPFRFGSRGGGLQCAQRSLIFIPLPVNAGVPHE